MLSKLTFKTEDHGLNGFLTKKIREEAVQLIADQPGNLLDLCCGNGIFLSLITNHHNLKLFGLDRSKELLAEAQFQKYSGIKNASLILGDARTLPFKPNYFHKIVCLNTLLNLQLNEDFKQILLEIAKISAPGAHLIFDVRNKNNLFIRTKYWLHQRSSNFLTNAYGMDEINQVLTACGFKIHQIKPVGWLHFAYLIDAIKI